MVVDCLDGCLSTLPGNLLEALFGSNGNASRCEVVLALSNARPLCGPIMWAPRAISNVLGRVPLMPLFLHGNSTLTIPHCFSNLQLSYSHMAVQTWPRSLAEGKQRLWGEPMVVALWEEQASSERVCQCLSLRYCKWLWCKKGLGVVMPPGLKGGAMLQRLRWPSEARNESGLTRKDVHGKAMVVPKYDKITQGYLNLCWDIPNTNICVEIIKDRYKISKSQNV